MCISLQWTYICASIICSCTDPGPLAYINGTRQECGLNISSFARTGLTIKINTCTQTNQYHIHSKRVTTNTKYHRVPHQTYPTPHHSAPSAVTPRKTVITTGSAHRRTVCDPRSYTVRSHRLVLLTSPVTTAVCPV